MGRGELRRAKLVWRCLEFFFILAPCLATLPLLKWRRSRARWLRLLVSTLERCGPVGIKWGQWASTRYDIFEDDLCDGLGMLTNAAPVHPLAYTEEIFRTELGQGIYSLFDDFSPILTLFVLVEPTQKIDLSFVACDQATGHPNDALQSFSFAVLGS